MTDIEAPKFEKMSLTASKPSYPIRVLKQALKYQPGHKRWHDKDRPYFDQPSAFAVRARLCRETFNALVLDKRVLSRKGTIQMVSRIVRISRDSQLDWERVADLTQNQVLAVNLVGLGKRILPRGREILRSDDPFMEIFFFDDAYILRQLGGAILGANPDKLRIFFATRPIIVSSHPDIYPQCSMQEFGPDDNFLLDSLKNRHVRNMYRELDRRITDYDDKGRTDGVVDKSFCFAMVQSRGDRTVSFEFDPGNFYSQLEAIMYYRYVQTSIGGLSDVKRELIEKSEKEAGIHFPKGHISIKWNGARRVTNEGRGFLVETLLKNYHHGDLQPVSKGHSKP